MAIEDLNNPMLPELDIPDPSVPLTPDVPPMPAAKKKKRAPVKTESATPVPKTLVEGDPQLRTKIFDTAQKYGIPPGLFLSLAYNESSLRHSLQGGGLVKSPTGATGIFQFTQATANRFGINREDPDQNIDGAARYLLENYNKAKESGIADDREAWLAAAVAHNRGEGAVFGKGGMIKNGMFVPRGYDKGNGGSTSKYAYNLAKEWADFEEYTGGKFLPSDEVQANVAPPLPPLVQSIRPAEIPATGATPEEIEQFKKIYPNADIPGVPAQQPPVQTTPPGHIVSPASVQPFPSQPQPEAPVQQPVQQQAPAPLVVPGDKKGSASQIEGAPAWLLGNTFPKTKLPEGTDDAYLGFLSEYNARDTEEARQKFLAGTTPEDMQYAQNLQAALETGTTAGQAGQPASAEQKSISVPIGKLTDFPAKVELVMPDDPRLANQKGTDFIPTGSLEFEVKIPKNLDSVKASEEALRQAVIAAYLLVGDSQQNAIAKAEQEVAKSRQRGAYFEEGLIPPEVIKKGKATVTIRLRNLNAAPEKIGAFVDTLIPDIKKSFEAALTKENPIITYLPGKEDPRLPGFRSPGRPVYWSDVLKAREVRPEEIETFRKYIEEGMPAIQDKVANVLAPALESVFNLPVILGQGFSAFSPETRIDDRHFRESAKKDYLDRYKSEAAAGRVIGAYDELPWYGKIAGTITNTTKSLFSNLLVSPVKTAVFLQSIADDINKAALGQSAPQMGSVDALGFVADAITNSLTTPASEMPAKFKELQDKYYEQASKDLKDKEIWKILNLAEEAFQTDPLFRNRFLGKVGETAGSLLSFIALGGLLSGVGKVGSTSFKLGPFNLESGSLISGATISAGPGYDEGKAAGMGELDAKLYALWSGLVGTSEALGAGNKIGEGLPPAGKAAFFSWFAKNILRNNELAEKTARVGLSILKASGEEGAEELLQETGQNVAQEFVKNYITRHPEQNFIQRFANEVANLPRSIAQQMADSGFFAALSGFFMGGFRGLPTKGRGTEVDEASIPNLEGFTPPFNVPPTEPTETQGAQESQQQQQAPPPVGPTDTQGAQESQQQQAPPPVVPTETQGAQESQQQQAPPPVVPTDTQGAQESQQQQQAPPPVVPTDTQGAQESQQQQQAPPPVGPTETQGAQESQQQQAPPPVVPTETQGEQEKTPQEVRKLLSGYLLDGFTESEARRRLRIGESIESVSEDLGVPQEVLRNLPPLGEIGPYGQRSHYIRNALVHPAFAKVFNKVAEIFAGANVKQVEQFQPIPPGEVTFRNVDALLDRIAQTVGKPRSSKMTDEDWYKILRQFDKSLPQEFKDVVLDSMEGYHLHKKYVNKILNSPEFQQAFQEAVDYIAEKSRTEWEPQNKNAFWPTFWEDLKELGLPEISPQSESHPTYWLRERILAAGRKYARQQYTKRRIISDGTIAKIFDKAMERYIQGGTGGGVAQRAARSDSQQRQKISGESESSRGSGKGRSKTRTAESRFREQQETETILSNLSDKPPAVAVSRMVNRLRVLAQEAGIEADNVEDFLKKIFRSRNIPIEYLNEKISLDLTAGKEIQIDVPGQNKSYEARYVLARLKDIQPSHDPGTFGVNPLYQHRNDRQYNDNSLYQEQVLTRATPENFEPRYLLTDSPTAELGAPIIDSLGNVLGGNSRSMMLLRIAELHPETLNEYYNELKKEASRFGFSEKVIEEKIAQGEPFGLFRQVTEEIEPQKAISDFNLSSVTGMANAEFAAAKARHLEERHIDYITRIMDELGSAGDTLNKTLDARGTKILNYLVETGILTSSEAAGFIDEDTITSEGKKFIERVLLSKVLGAKASSLANAPAITKQVILRSIRAIMYLAKTPWSLNDIIDEAATLLGQMKEAGFRDVDQYVEQGRLFEREEVSEAGVIMARFLFTNSPLRANQRFQKYVAAAQYAERADQAFFDFAPRRWEDVFHEAFNTNTEFVPVFEGQESPEGEQNRPDNLHLFQKIREENAPSDGHQYKNAGEALKNAGNLGKAARTILTALNKVAPGLRITIHNTSESYNHALSRTSRTAVFTHSRGFYFAPSGIHIDGTLGDITTLYHEASHALIAIAAAFNPEISDKFAKEAANMWPDITEETAKQYSEIPEAQRNMEIIAKAFEKVSRVPSMWDNFKAWLNRLLRALGLDFLTETRIDPYATDFRTFLKKTAQAFRQGKTIVLTSGQNKERTLSAGLPLNFNTARIMLDGVTGEIRNKHLAEHDNYPVMMQPMTDKHRRVGLLNSIEAYIWDLPPTPGTKSIQQEAGGSAKNFTEVVRNRVLDLFDQLNNPATSIPWTVKRMTDSYLMLAYNTAVQMNDERMVSMITRAFYYEESREDYVRLVAGIQKESLEGWLDFLKEEQDIIRHPENHSPEEVRKAVAVAYWMLHNVITKIPTTDPKTGQIIFKKRTDSTVEEFVSAGPYTQEDKEAIIKAGESGQEFYDALYDRGKGEGGRLFQNTSFTRTDAKLLDNHVWYVIPQGSPEREVHQVARFLGASRVTWCSKGVATLSGQISLGNGYLLVDHTNRFHPAPVFFAYGVPSENNTANGGIPDFGGPGGEQDFTTIEQYDEAFRFLSEKGANPEGLEQLFRSKITPTVKEQLDERRRTGEDFRPYERKIQSLDEFLVAWLSAKTDEEKMARIKNWHQSDNLFSLRLALREVISRARGPRRSVKRNEILEKLNAWLDERLAGQVLEIGITLRNLRKPVLEIPEGFLEQAAKGDAVVFFNIKTVPIKREGRRLAKAIYAHLQELQIRLAEAGISDAKIRSVNIIKTNELNVFDPSYSLSFGADELASLNFIQELETNGSLSIHARSRHGHVSLPFTKLNVNRLRIIHDAESEKEAPVLDLSKLETLTFTKYPRMKGEGFVEPVFKIEGKRAVSIYEESHRFKLILSDTQPLVINNVPAEVRFFNVNVQGELVANLSVGERGGSQEVSKFDLDASSATILPDYNYDSGRIDSRFSFSSTNNSVLTIKDKHVPENADPVNLSLLSIYSGGRIILADGNPNKKWHIGSVFLGNGSSKDAFIIEHPQVEINSFDIPVYQNTTSSIDELVKVSSSVKPSVHTFHVNARDDSKEPLNLSAVQRLLDATLRPEHAWTVSLYIDTPLFESAPSFTTDDPQNVLSLSGLQQINFNLVVPNDAPADFHARPFESLKAETAFLIFNIDTSRLRSNKKVTLEAPITVAGLKSPDGRPHLSSSSIAFYTTDNPYNRTDLTVKADVKANIDTLESLRISSLSPRISESDTSKNTNSLNVQIEGENAGLTSRSGSLKFALSNFKTVKVNNNTPHSLAVEREEVIGTDSSEIEIASPKAVYIDDEKRDRSNDNVLDKISVLFKDSPKGQESFHRLVLDQLINNAEVSVKAENKTSLERLSITNAAAGIAVNVTTQGINEIAALNITPHSNSAGAGLIDPPVATIKGPKRINSINLNFELIYRLANPGNTAPVLSLPTLKGKDAINEVNLNFAAFTTRMDSAAQLSRPPIFAVPEEVTPNEVTINTRLPNLHIRPNMPDYLTFAGELGLKQIKTLAIQETHLSTQPYFVPQKHTWDIALRQFFDSITDIETLTIENSSNSGDLIFPALTNLRNLEIKGRQANSVEYPSETDTEQPASSAGILSFPLVEKVEKILTKSNHNVLPAHFSFNLEMPGLKEAKSIAIKERADYSRGAVILHMPQLKSTGILALDVVTEAEIPQIEEAGLVMLGAIENLSVPQNLRPGSVRHLVLLPPAQEAAFDSGQNRLALQQFKDAAVEIENKTLSNEEIEQALSTPRFSLANQEDNLPDFWAATPIMVDRVEEKSGSKKRAEMAGRAIRQGREGYKAYARGSEDFFAGGMAMMNYRIVRLGDTNRFAVFYTAIAEGSKNLGNEPELRAGIATGLTPVAIVTLDPASQTPKVLSVKRDTPTPEEAGLWAEKTINALGFTLKNREDDQNIPDARSIAALNREIDHLIEQNNLVQPELGFTREVVNTFHDATAMQTAIADKTSEEAARLRLRVRQEQAVKDAVSLLDAFSAMQKIRQAERSGGETSVLEARNEILDKVEKQLKTLEARGRDTQYLREFTYQLLARMSQSNLPPSVLSREILQNIDETFGESRLEDLRKYAERAAQIQPALASKTIARRSMLRLLGNSVLREATLRAALKEDPEIQDISATDKMLERLGGMSKEMIKGLFERVNPQTQANYQTRENWHEHIRRNAHLTQAAEQMQEGGWRETIEKAEVRVRDGVIWANSEAAAILNLVISADGPVRLNEDGSLADKIPDALASGSFFPAQYLNNNETRFRAVTASLAAQLPADLRIKLNNIALAPLIYRDPLYRDATFVHTVDFSEMENPKKSETYREETAHRIFGRLLLPERNPQMQEQVLGALKALYDRSPKFRKLVNSLGESYASYPLLSKIDEAVTKAFASQSDIYLTKEEIEDAIIEFYQAVKEAVGQEALEAYLNEIAEKVEISQGAGLTAKLHAFENTIPDNLANRGAWASQSLEPTDGESGNAERNGIRQIRESRIPGGETTATDEYAEALATPRFSKRGRIDPEKINRPDETGAPVPDENSIIYEIFEREASKEEMANLESNLRFYAGQIKKLIFDGKSDVTPAEAIVNFYRSTFLAAISVASVNLGAQPVHIAITEASRPLYVAIDAINALINPKAKGVRSVPLLTLQDVINGLFGEKGLFREGLGKGEKGAIGALLHGVGLHEIGKYEIGATVFTETEGKFLRQTGSPLVDGFMEGVRRLAAAYDRPFKAYARASEKEAFTRLLEDNLYRQRTNKDLTRDDIRRYVRNSLKVNSFIQVMLEHHAEYLTLQHTNAITEGFETLKRWFISKEGAQETLSKLKGMEGTKIPYWIGQAGYTIAGMSVLFTRVPFNFGSLVVSYTPLGLLMAGWHFHKMGQSYERTAAENEHRQEYQQTMKGLMEAARKQQAVIGSIFRNAQKKLEAEIREAKAAYQAEKREINLSPMPTSERKERLRRLEKEWERRENELQTALSTLLHAKEAAEQSALADNAGLKASIEAVMRAEEKMIDLRFTMLEQRRFVTILGNAGIGTTIGMSALWLIAMGLASITGGGEGDDERKRNKEKNIAGIPDYTVRIGDAYYRYDLLPLGRAVALFVDIFEQWQRRGTYSQKMAAVTFKALKSLTQLNPYTATYDTQTDFASIAGSKAVRFTPLGPSVFREISEILDPVSRTAFNKGFEAQFQQSYILPQFRAKSPFTGRELPKREPPLSTRGETVWERLYTTFHPFKPVRAVRNIQSVRPIPFKREQPAR